MKKNSAKRGAAPLLHIERINHNTVDHFRVQLAVADDTFSATFDLEVASAAQSQHELRQLIEEYPRLQEGSYGGLVAGVSERIEQVGRELSNMILGRPPVKKIFEVLNTNGGLSATHVRITDDARGVWLPWELLRLNSTDPPCAVEAASFAMSPAQITGLGVLPSRPPVSKPLRILLVVSRPLDGDLPYRTIANKVISAASHRDSSIQVSLLRPPTLDALRSRLATAAAAGRPFDAVHFDGHGVIERDEFSAGMLARGYLLFESKENRTDLVSGRTLGRVLTEYRVSILLLNACRSSFSGQAEAGKRDDSSRVMNSAAADAIDSGVPQVLAMSYNIYVSVAVRLVGDTYAGLSHGMRLAEAVTFARRLEFNRTETQFSTSWEWSIPMVYDSESPRYSDTTVLVEDVANLPSLSQDTEISCDCIVRVGDGFRARSTPFVGRDDTILELDRLFEQNAIIQLSGLTGSGKSALLDEFGRWGIATSAFVGALVVQCATSKHVGEIRSNVARGHSSMPTSCNPETTAIDRFLYLFDDLDRFLASVDQTEEYNRRYRELTAFLNELVLGGAKILLTSRRALDLGQTANVVLAGLDVSDSLELASAAGAAPALLRNASSYLDWAMGIPALALMLPAILPSNAEVADVQEAVNRLGWAIDHRGGFPTELDDRDTDLLEQLELVGPDLMRINDATSILVLTIFHGYITQSMWQMFCKILDAHLTGLIGTNRTLAWIESELSTAAEVGLACKVNDTFYLHPMTPLLMRPAIFQLFGFVRDVEVGVKMLLIVLGAHNSLLAIESRLPDFSKNNRSSKELRHPNVWRSLTWAITCRLWIGVLQLIVNEAEYLKSLGRADDWYVLVRRILDGMRDEPLCGEDATELTLLAQVGPQPLELLSAEASHLGYDDMALSIRVIAARLRVDASRRGEGSTSEEAKSVSERRDMSPTRAASTAGEGDAELGTMAVGRASDVRYSTLLRLGDALARDNSAECEAMYLQAIADRRECGDQYRLPQALLRLSQALFHIPAIRDLGRSELLAREALVISEKMGPFGQEALMDAKFRISHALATRFAEGGDLDEAQVREVVAGYQLVAVADRSLDRRAAGRNNLGCFYLSLGKFSDAAAEFVEALALYESLGHEEEVLTGRTNLAIAFSEDGRESDAREVARSIYRDFRELPDHLRKLLAKILPSIP